MDQDELYIYLDLAREADLNGEIKTADAIEGLMRLSAPARGPGGRFISTEPTPPADAPTPTPKTRRQSPKRTTTRTDDADFDDMFADTGSSSPVSQSKSQGLRDININAGPQVPAGLAGVDPKQYRADLIRLGKLQEEKKALQKQLEQQQASGDTEGATNTAAQIGQNHQRQEETAGTIAEQAPPNKRRNLIRNLLIGGAGVAGAIGVGTWMNYGRNVDAPDKTPATEVTPTSSGSDFQLDTQPASERARTNTPSVPDSTLLSWMQAKKAKKFNGVPVFKASTTLKELYGWAFAEKGKNFANSLNAYIRRNFGISGPTAQFGSTNYNSI